MTCTQCGCEQVAGAQFCRQCGVPLRAPGQAPGPAPSPAPGPAPFPPPYPGYGQPMLYPPPSRVRQNLQPLGIMWCIFGAYRILAVLFAGAMLHTFAAEGMFGGIPPFARDIVHAMLPVVLVMIILLGSVAILTGYALLTRRPWARVLGIVMAILSLIRIPFGTALGIYTLWVLAPHASGFEWEAMSGSEL